MAPEQANTHSFTCSSLETHIDAGKYPTEEFTTGFQWVLSQVYSLPFQNNYILLIKPVLHDVDSMHRCAVLPEGPA